MATEFYKDNLYSVSIDFEDSTKDLIFFIPPDLFDKDEDGNKLIGNKVCEFVENKIDELFDGKKPESYEIVDFDGAYY